MNHKITEREWLEDFSDFVSSEGTSVPDNVSQNILSYVHRELNPSAWFVFAKLMGIHSVVGTLSLSICEQFGMSPFSTGISLTEFFMRLGHSICMALCGFLFVGLSVALAFFMLKSEELSVLKKNSWIQIPSLGLLSLAVFIGFGAEMVFGIGFLWFIGAMLGGFTPILIRNLKTA
ncbi:MAG: hypothetical protein IPJ71_04400 [Bdellovibrionales bacterium]|nr:hypothetical protein [Bdellovibrionales bacterium]